MKAMQLVVCNSANVVELLYYDENYMMEENNKSVNRNINSHIIL